MSADEEESASGPWCDRSAPVAELVDETSRDSGICLTEATSADDDTYHEFSVLMRCLICRANVQRTAGDKTCTSKGYKSSTTLEKPEVSYVRVDNMRTA